MKALSCTACGIQRSPIRAIFDSAARFADAIHLEIGQPDFSIPQHVAEAAVVAARSAFTGYTSNRGMIELREAILVKLARDNDLHFGTENIMVTTGAMQALFSTMAVLLEQGEEILLPDPGYGNFDMAAQVLGAVCRSYPTIADQDFVPDFEAMEQMVTPRTKALLVCSPSNPTGAVYNEQVMRACFDFCERHDLYFISDETYDQLVFEGEHISPLQWDTEGRVIGIYTLSKTYAMTGWRIGYAVADTEVIDAMATIQEPIVSCVNTVAQHAAIAALTGPQDDAHRMYKHYKRRRDLATQVATGLSLTISYPHGAFYLLVDISSYQGGSIAFCDALLEAEHVAVAPGAAFGGLCERYVRLSLCCSEDDIRTGITRLASFLADADSCKSGAPAVPSKQLA